MKEALIKKKKAEDDAAGEEEVEEENKRIPLKKKDLARITSEKYSSKEAILSGDGLESKDPLKVDLYVDTHYVDYMLSGVTGECMYEIYDLKRRTKDNTETISKLLESHENQTRWVQTQMFRIGKQALHTDQILNKNVIDKHTQNRRKLVWTVWREYMEGIKIKKTKLTKMVQAMQKYHLKPAFLKYKHCAA